MTMKRRWNERRHACVAGLLRLLLGGTVMLLASVPSTTRAQASNSVRSLHFTHRADSMLTLSGSHWKFASRVLLTVHSSWGVVGREVKTTTRGTFVVGLNHIDMCSGVQVDAYDLHGHVTRVHSTPLRCLTPINSPRPSIMIVVGQSLAGGAVAITGSTFPAVVQMHVGDRIVIAEGGTTLPEFRPHPDIHFFVEIDARARMGNACAGPNCQFGYSWTYVAVRPGDTVIDMAPGCREVTPACGRPDLGLRVHITP